MKSLPIVCLAVCIWVLPTSAGFINVADPGTPLADPYSAVRPCWGDFDNDNDLDLYQCNRIGVNCLFRNDGDDVFPDVALDMGVAESLRTESAAWGDFDEDGDLDLYLGVNNNWPNRLYRNDGLVFVDVAAETGTADSLGMVSNAVYSPSWLDYDRDGDLDLYVCNASAELIPNRMFRNDGGVFVDVATEIGLADTRPTIVPAFADYDNDGDPDVYLTNWDTPNALFRNDDGIYRDITYPPLGDPGYSLGGAWGDYDLDGDLDLHFSNMDSPDRLFRNDGNDQFVDVAPALGLDDPTDSRGGWWIDYDNDADLDLHVIHNDWGEGYDNNLWRNDGGTFVDVAVAEGIDDAGHGMAFAWADYDNDGDVEFYLSLWNQPNRLYRNDLAAANHWLHFSFIGTTSNRSVIGTRVRLVAGGVEQIGEVSRAGPLEFGLGNAATVETIEVRWPSGLVQVETNLPWIDQQLTWVEGSSPWPTTAVESAAVPTSPIVLHQNRPNPFNPSTTIRYDLAASASVQIRIFDVEGHALRMLEDAVHAPAGLHEVRWDGRDDRGHMVSSGVYYYRIEAGDWQETRAMVLVK